MADYVQENLNYKTLSVYFRNREAKPEFYDDNFFSERNHLPGQELSVRKAQRIFLKGAVQHVRSVQEDMTFTKGWRPRMQGIKQFNETSSLKLAFNHLNKQYKNEDNRYEIGC
jgi:hypothetical protein